MKGFLERLVQQRLEDSLKGTQITMIIGSRQVGKSTLMQHAMDYVQKSQAISDGGAIRITNNTFSYILDDIQLRGYLKKDIRYIQKDIELSLGESLEKIETPVYIFIDEVQKLPVLFDWVKQIFDANSRNVKFILTGSSAVGMANIAAETLAGRVEYITVYPFVYGELLQARTGLQISFISTLIKEIDSYYGSHASNTTDSILEQLQGASVPTKEEQRFKKFLEGYLPSIYSQTKQYAKDATAIAVENLFYGGLPRIITSGIEERIRLIKNYISVYLEKEIGSIARNLDVELFSLSLQSFAQQNGQTVNINQVSKEVGISRPSLYKYLDLLENTYLVKKISPYVRNATSEETTKSIVLYYLDTGILNNLTYTTSIQEMIRPDTYGRIIGSWLLCMLEANFSLLDMAPPLFYWQDYAGHRIDLVFERQDYMFGFMLNKPKDPRRERATIEKFVENTDKENVIIFYPYFDAQKMSLEYKITEIEHPEKKILGIEIPIQFFA